MKIYRNDETKKRIEESKKFSLSFPFEAEIADGLENLTLEQVGQKLTSQFQKNGAVGVELIEIRASIIFDS